MKTVTPSKYIEYVFSETLVKVSDGSPVIALYLQSSEKRPVTLQHISVENARELHADLGRLLSDIYN